MSRPLCFKMNLIVIPSVAEGFAGFFKQISPLPPVGRNDKTGRFPDFLLYHSGRQIPVESLVEVVVREFIGAV